MPDRRPADDLRLAVVARRRRALPGTPSAAGGAPDAELVAEFTRRYQVIGGSPLIADHARPRRRPSERARRRGRVRAGMRFSEPTIERALATLAAPGVGASSAIILSPQYSPLLMGGYVRADRRGPSDARRRTPRRSTSPGRGTCEPAFVEALAGRIRAALGRLRADERRHRRRCS